MTATARERARTALALDAVVFIVGACVAPRGRLLVVGIGVAFLAAAALATRVYLLGYVMAVARAFAALILLVWAATATALLLLTLAEVVSALNGCLAARAARWVPRRPLARRISERSDEVVSAIIHFGFIGLIAVGVAVEGHYASAVGFLSWWIAITWGTVAVHEAGHALAALGYDNEVTEVRVGTGLQVARLGRWRFGAIPFRGRTAWVANKVSMTTRRELVIVLAGPATNALVAAVLFALPFVRHSGFGMWIVGVQLLEAGVNLVPVDVTTGRRPRRSDGARALELLRSQRAVR